MSRMSQITEKTLVPLSALGLVVGAVFWLTTLHNNVSANTRVLDAVTERQEQYNKDVAEIKTKLALLLQAQEIGSGRGRSGP